MKKGLVAAALALGLLGYAAYSEYGPRAVPSSQPALVRVDSGNFATVRAQFNEAADRVRVVTLLSPT